MRRSAKNWGTCLIWTFPLVAILLGLLYYPESSIRHHNHPFLVYASQLAALSGYALFALSFVLAARWRWMEDYFGGLDRMYQLHHTIARLALILILIHPLLLAARWLPDDWGKFTGMLLPRHRRVVLNTAVYAYYGFLFLMLLTLVRFLSYDKWKITHKWMGLIFILSTLHIFTTDVTFIRKPILFLYLGTLTIAGMLAFLYKTIFFRLLVKPQVLTVANVMRLNEQVLRIEMEAATPFSFRAGQYYFFRFFSSKLTREAHPFTVCSRPTHSTVQIMVKSLGDYTKQLYEHLSVGTRVEAEGPYGRFDYQQGKKAQVWIAGGVGVAPFIAWAEELRETSGNPVKADFYYCVKHEGEATHLAAFKDLAAQDPNFAAHLIREDQEGFLCADQIPDVQQKEVFICGPRPMLKALVKQLRHLHVPASRIHYENFDFS